MYSIIVSPGLPHPGEEVHVKVVPKFARALHGGSMNFPCKVRCTSDGILMASLDTDSMKPSVVRLLEANVKIHNLT